MAETKARPTHEAAIESCTLFNALTSEQKAGLVEKSYMAFADRGETIWMAGAPSAFSAIAATGFVKLTRTTPMGQEVAVDLIGPGQAFGALVALEGKPFPLAAVAVTSCWYLKIPTRVLLEIYRQSSAFKEQIVRTIAPRLRRAHEMMARLSTGSAEERIAAVLLILGDSYGRTEGNKVTLEVPLTRQEIGEMAGTTVETTIRVVSRWQKDGLLKTDQKIITIIDKAELERILSGL